VQRYDFSLYLPNFLAFIFLLVPKIALRSEKTWVKRNQQRTNLMTETLYSDTKEDYPFHLSTKGLLERKSCSTPNRVEA
jgi:hypothetical protein